MFKKNSLLKDDFQSSLRTLESCFRFVFCFMHDVTALQLLTLIKSKFQNNRHYGCEAVEA